MRLRRRLITPDLLALAAMLFLQAAIGFAACELPERSAGILSTMAQSATQPECHEPEQDQGLCIAHCAAQDQTVTKAQFSLPELAAHSVTPVRVAAIDLPPAVPMRAPAAPAAGPPARIRFQSFLL